MIGGPLLELIRVNPHAHDCHPFPEQFWTGGIMLTELGKGTGRRNRPVHGIMRSALQPSRDADRQAAGPQRGHHWPEGPDRASISPN